MSEHSHDAIEADEQRASTMLKCLERLWRQLATGFCFVVFGLGCVMVMLVTPFIMLFYRQPQDRERCVKHLIHNCFRVFTWLMQALRAMYFSGEGLQALRQPGQLIVANHPTLIDVVVLISFLPKADCVVKSGLLRNPFTRLPVQAAGYIVNDNDPMIIVEKVKASLARGNSVIIFPEGTRTVPGQPLSLQRGAANIAVRTGNKMQAVTIECQPSTLTKGTPWYRVPERAAHMHLRRGKIFELEPYRQLPPSLAARQLTRAMAEYFTGELQRHERADHRVETTDHRHA